MKRIQAAAIAAGIVLGLLFAAEARAQWCGDEYCDSWWGEDEFSCPEDCNDCYQDLACFCPNAACTLEYLCYPSVCGDGVCVDGEDFDCFQDCYQVCCFNDICDWDESLYSCPRDCDVCGNDYCGPYESESSCPADCAPVWDADRDLIPDDYELAHAAMIPPLNSANPADAAADFDGDGNPNLHEIWNGSNPWSPDPVPDPGYDIGCYYWGKADNGPYVQPSDINQIQMAYVGAAPAGPRWGAIFRPRPIWTDRSAPAPAPTPIAV